MVLDDVTIRPKGPAMPGAYSRGLSIGKHELPTGVNRQLQGLLLADNEPSNSRPLTINSPERFEKIQYQDMTRNCTESSNKRYTYLDTFHASSSSTSSDFRKSESGASYGTELSTASSTSPSPKLTPQRLPLPEVKVDDCLSLETHEGNQPGARDDPYRNPSYHDRFREVVNLFRRNTYEDPKLRESMRFIDYTLKLCGTSPADARPSILAFCRKSDFKALNRLLTNKELKYQYCLRRSSWRPTWLGQETVASTTSDKPLFNLYFWRQGRPRSLFWGKCHAKVHDSRSDAYPEKAGRPLICGSIVEIRIKDIQFSTLGCTLQIGSEWYITTSRHAFRHAFGTPTSAGHLDGESKPALSITKPATEPGKEVDRIYGSESDPSDVGAEDYLVDDIEYESLPEDDEEDDWDEEETQIALDSYWDKINSTHRKGQNGAVEEAPVIFITSEDLDKSGDLDLDWALLKWEKPNGHTWVPNTYGSPSLPSTIFLSKVSQSQPVKETSVLVLTSHQSPRHGVLQPGTAMLGGISGRQSSIAWIVLLNEKRSLTYGDSGALVIDALTNDIYGHVIGSNPLGEIYISPFVSVLQQIRQKFPGQALSLLEPPKMNANASATTDDTIELYHSLPELPKGKGLSILGESSQPHWTNTPMSKAGRPQLIGSGPSTVESQPGASPKSQRKAKGHVASACVPCKKAHLSNGKEDSCHDIIHKTRERPRLRDNREARYDLLRPLPPHDNAFRRSRYAEEDVYGRPIINSRPQEPVAYLTLDLEFSRVSDAFNDTIGGLGPRRTLAETVALSEREKIKKLQNELSIEQKQIAPNYLPPILGRGEQVLSGIGFTLEDVGRFLLRYPEYLTFVAVDGQTRVFPVQIGLAKEGSFFFVVALLGIGNRLQLPVLAPHLIAMHQWPTHHTEGHKHDSIEELEEENFEESQFEAISGGDPHPRVRVYPYPDEPHAAVNFGPAGNVFGVQNHSIPELDESYLPTSRPSSASSNSSAYYPPSGSLLSPRDVYYRQTHDPRNNSLEEMKRYRDILPSGAVPTATATALMRTRGHSSSPPLHQSGPPLTAQRLPQRHSSDRSFSPSRRRDRPESLYQSRYENRNEAQSEGRHSIHTAPASYYDGPQIVVPNLREPRGELLHDGNVSYGQDYQARKTQDDSLLVHMDILRGIRTRHDPYSGSRPIDHQRYHAAAINYQQYVDSSMPLTAEALWRASNARGSGLNRRSTTSYATSRSSASIRTGRTSQSYDTDITAPSEYGGSDAGTLRNQRSSIDDDIGILAARRFQRAPEVRQSLGDSLRGLRAEYNRSPPDGMFSRHDNPRPSNTRNLHSTTQDDAGRELRDREGS
ncbi:unnamed protein product, partial [Clonostachys chloroleuca]